MENLIIQTFSILIQAIVELYIIISLSKKLAKVERYEKKQIGLMFLGIILASLTSILLDFLNLAYLKTIFFTLIELIAIKLILKQSFKNSIIIEIICYFLFVIAEILSASISMALFKDDISILIAKFPTNIIISLTTNFIAFIIIEIFNIIFNKKKIKVSGIEKMNIKNIIFLVSVTLIYVLPQMILFVFNKYSYPVSFLLLNCVQFIIINVFTFYFLRKDMDYQKSKEDLITSEIHNKTLIGMIDGVRTLKHDYNNIIQSLNGYVVTKQYDKLEDHIKSLLKECNGINNISSIDPKIFNDPAIYGIVGSKYFLANEKGIPFEFDITTDIAGLDFPKPELSRILGILIDNAIEATTKSSNPFIRLQIRFDNRKCADLIKIYNTYDTSIDINLQDIFKKGYSSKEVKSGIGLWEVKKLVKHNPNSQIYASIEENMFVQNIVIER